MSELDWQLHIMSDTLGSPDPISFTTLPCENYNDNVFYFTLRIVSKQQRLVLQTMAHVWNPRT